MTEDMNWDEELLKIYYAANGIQPDDERYNLSALEIQIFPPEVIEDSDNEELKKFLLDTNESTKNIERTSFAKFAFFAISQAFKLNGFAQQKVQLDLGLIKSFEEADQSFEDAFLGEVALTGRLAPIDLQAFEKRMKDVFQQHSHDRAAKQSILHEIGQDQNNMRNLILRLQKACQELGINYAELSTVGHIEKVSPR